MTVLDQKPVADAEAHLSAIVAVASGHPGTFVLCSFNDGLPAEVVHVANDANTVATMRKTLARWSKHRKNSYISLALYRDDLPEGSKGTEQDIVAVLGVVTDFDAKQQPATFRERMPVEPSIIVETSAGNFQAAILFDKPVPFDVAKPLAQALARATGCDPISADVSHQWRIAGTYNNPSKKKIAAGRSPDPQMAKLLQCDDWLTITPEALRDAIPRKSPDAFEKIAAQKDTAEGFDWNARKRARKDRDPSKTAIALSSSGDRSGLAFKEINSLARSGYSPTEIRSTLTELQHMPVMQHYVDHVSGFDASLEADIVRAFVKPAPERQTVSEIFRVFTVGCETKIPESKRQIQIVQGNVSANVAEAEAALLEQQTAAFTRGAMLVQPAEIKVQIRDGREVSDLLLAPVNATALAAVMGSAAQFVKYDARTEGLKQIDCPRNIADTYLAQCGNWKLRYLDGVINAPTLRPDGTLLDTAGYDAATGLLYDPRGAHFPDIPEKPTRDDAVKSLTVFDELFGGFPFANKEARAVILAAVLTGTIRRTLPGAPIFGIDAPAAGSGKSLAADTIAVIASGRPASPITTGANEEELEKRLHSMLIRGDGVILVDNIDAPVGSSALCSILTQETASVRVLGKSLTIPLSANCLFLATGNNLTFVGDMWRRALTALIDPRVERPSERSFDFNPVERARRDRGRYVAAALTILRAYQVAGRPPQKGKVMGSFETWCQTVRDPLLWLGEADPVATCAPPPDDPEHERLGALLAAWADIVGIGHRATAAEALDKAQEAAMSDPPRPALLDAMKAVAPANGHGASLGVDTGALASWVAAKRLQVCDGLRLLRDSKGNGGVRYRLEQITKRLTP